MKLVLLLRLTCGKGSINNRSPLRSFIIILAGLIPKAYDPFETALYVPAIPVDLASDRPEEPICACIIGAVINTKKTIIILFIYYPD
jgi:hypothetical protein